MITQLFIIPLRILVVAATLPTPPALGAIATGASPPAVVTVDAGDPRPGPKPTIAIAPTG